MASNRVLLLTAACVCLLGVPGWPAQPAQDTLPQDTQVQDTQNTQVEESPAQDMQTPDSVTQDSAAQDNQVGDSQAQDTYRTAPRRSSAMASSSYDKHSAKAAKRDPDKPVPADALANPVLWQMPQDISSKDLFYGQGGAPRQPRPPFTFISEDTHGNSPKFECRDANHRKWKVKLGSESRPEVVASRLMWAVGYLVNDDYVLPRAEVRGLKLQRGKHKGNTVFDARFSRKPGSQEKIGIWRWKENPFFGTREFNGLRVMMAVMNNWDLKDSNNAVHEDRNHQQLFLVSDLGSSFGTNTIKFPAGGSKGDAGSYERSKFVTRNDGMEVDFATPAPPTNVLVRSMGFAAMAYVQHKQMDWIGNNIPVPDAHWIGTLLGQLSHKQLVDAFRAGNFPPEEIESYVTVLESRIHELQEI